MDIDREVAEKVMGWVTTITNHRAGLHMRRSEGVYNDDSGKFVCYKLSFTPSTNIAQAFEVVEKMQKGGWKFFSIEVDDLYNGGMWKAVFYTPPNPFIEYADTPATAICLAALKAIEPGREGG